MARKFAFGANELPTCQCPASASGRRVTGPVLTVAEEYDSIARGRTGVDEGEIPKAMAKECWEQALQNIRTMKEDETEREHIGYLSDAIEEGEDVLETVFK